MVGEVCELVPVRLTTWGLPLALSAIESDARCVPIDFGEKESAIKQLLFAGSSTPLQPSLVTEKSAAFEPFKPIVILERGALPLFVNVMTTELLEAPVKLATAGDTLAIGTTPLPVKPTDRVDPGLP
jgi:hypothetical protein